MKVALVHDWLTGMRGGERCLEVFCELFPEADLYTLLHIPGTVSPTIEKHTIQTSFIQRLPLSRTAYRYYLPFFPMAIESFDLTGYDLILSTSHCVAKGVRVPQGACHIAYIFTPMRYVWDQYEAYFGGDRSSRLVRAAMGLVRPRLQRWDVNSNHGIHAMAAISLHVADRIRRFYGREDDVIYPPVDFEAFSVSERDEGFYLIVTAFAPYKRVDLAIEAFNRLKLPLKIIGTGQDEKRLRQMAGPTIEFLGWKSDTEVREYYSTCRALIFPGEEDFGIVPLEAMACGKPVIAYGRGGVLETVVPLNGSPSDERPPTGVFFNQQAPEALIEAVRSFESHRHRFDPVQIREHVRPYDRRQFKEKIHHYIKLKFKEYKETDHAQKIQ